MKKFIIIVLLSILFSPVAYSKCFMEKALESWQGYSIEKVIKCWGYPDEEKVVAGRHLFLYKKTSAYTYYNEFLDRAETSYMYITFEVDENNIITNWQYKSNAAPLSYLLGKKYVNPENDQWKQKKQLEKEHKEEIKQMKMLAQ